MSKSSLSICIPIYNFGRFIGETLDSILNQDGTDQIEIVVVDGASTDHTETVMTAYTTQYPQIKYFRLAARGGIDNDMAISVEKASGDYCWLFSGDDTMVAGSLKKILDHISTGSEAYICKHYNSNVKMEVINTHPIMNWDTERTFDFSVPSEREEYFSIAQTTESFFSFMSGIIIKKSFWDSATVDQKYFSTCWALAARVLSKIYSGFRLTYIPDVYVNRRGDNDSFLTSGIVNRFDLSIGGFLMIFSDIFGEGSGEYSHLKRVLRNEFNVPVFMFAKAECSKFPKRESLEKLNTLFNTLYANAPETLPLKKLAYRVCPGWTYNVLRPAWRLVKRARLNELLR